ncbi:hypothetical protein HRbin22_00337 [Candidatus Thermoflexus japonica]|uniref:Uncharacterized protein n=1 Tax=Candidatus Thermoflexus japonica TaxID=2035417 RepID=A0A2H5Y3T2_9CHLR|nr:hypothetical protein HRbin22_00337 [Candidatus Thermoflexus japonica]
MTGTEPTPHRRVMRIYVVQLFQEPDGALHGRVTDPATMRQWVFRDLGDLPRILRLWMEGPPAASSEG